MLLLFEHKFWLSGIFFGWFFSNWLHIFIGFRAFHLQLAHKLNTLLHIIFLRIYFECTDSSLYKHTFIHSTRLVYTVCRRKYQLAMAVQHTKNHTEHECQNQMWFWFWFWFSIITKAFQSICAQRTKNFVCLKLNIGISFSFSNC